MAKFVWEFFYNGEERYLDIHLNGGLNKSIYFDHPDYYKFLNDALKEIMFYDHIVGNKTTVLGLEQITSANVMRKDQPIEVVKEQQLARRGSKGWSKTYKLL